MGVALPPWILAVKSPSHSQRWNGSLVDGLSANLKLAYTGLLFGKKNCLSGRILRVEKVAQPDANQAKPLLWPEADAFPQRQGDIRQFLARRRWRTWCVAASENLEFAGLQFQYNRSEEHTSELQSRRDLVCRLLLEKKKKKTK